jgi:glycosyltransferase A (GT-A) superfamily protein (DUF2064 family)
LGFVKRRLARDIGQLPAWQFYRRTLRALAPRLAADARWQTYLATTGGKVRWPGRAPLIDQGGGSLGERMARLLHVLPVGPVVIVGSDIPGIERRHIAEAFKALGKCDTVFGPAGDGGYWLVGQARRRLIPKLFENVRWSTRHALHDTMTNLDQRHSSQLLEVLIDVDDGASYRAWRDR